MLDFFNAKKYYIEEQVLITHSQHKGQSLHSSKRHKYLQHVVLYLQVSKNHY